MSDRSNNTSDGDGGGDRRKGAEVTEDNDRRNPAWTARGKLLLEFHDVISRAINNPGFKAKCDQIGRSMAEAEGHGNKVAARSTILQDYEAEADLIVENKARRDSLVRNKSLAVGAVSFIVLRSTRGLSSWMKAAIARRKASYKFDLPSPATGKSTVVASQPSIVKQPSRGRHLFWLSCDAALSTSLVFLSGTFLFMPPPSSFLRDMADLPLVAGKSVYAEYVCPPLLRDYRRVVEKHDGWPVPTSEDRLTKEDVSLNVIRRFIANCMKRKKYEAALDDERNAMSLKGSKSKLGAVVIPEPGVPDDEGIDLEKEVLADGDNEMP